MSLSPMLRAALTLCVVAAMLHIASAGYPPCSDPAVCLDSTEPCCNSISINGQTTHYCCPGVGNSLDWDSKTCTKSVDCPVPPPVNGNRTVTTGEQFVFHSGNVGKCSPFGVLDGKMTYAIVQHAPDQLQAAAAVARMEHHGTIPSSTGGGAVTAEMIRWISVLMHRQHRFQSQLSASLLV